MPGLIFRLRSIVTVHITCHCYGLSCFSALQKHFCSHIEACAWTKIHKPKERLIFFIVRHIKQFNLILPVNLFTEYIAKTTEIYVGFLEKFMQYLFKHFV